MLHTVQRSLATVLLALTACVGARPTAPPPGPSPIAHVREDVVLNIFDAFGHAGPGMTKSWGYSAIIRHRGHTILFDSGSNADVLAANASALGIDLRDVDIAILSHDHPDHSAGMDYLFSINPRFVLYAPSESNLGSDFDVRVAPPDPTLAALPTDQQYWDGRTATWRTHMSGRYWRGRVQFVEKHQEIAPGVVLVSTVSSNTGTFSAYPPNEAMPHLEGLRELSLVLDTHDGDVILVGCSHSGIENIVRAAGELRRKPIDLVTGGLHLLPYDRATIEALAERLRDEYGVRRIAPAHCTGHLGFQILRDTFGNRYLGGGLGSEVPIGP
jgi:7,8-dihydropterin-6-yl-methyl-4-(beta-D-ribofuranosyl)aminobenzene 5'-phosphate synthase